MQTKNFICEKEQKMDGEGQSTLKGEKDIVSTGKGY